MNEPEASAYVDRLAETVDARPVPLPDLLARGRAARRRRTATAVSLAAAATLVTVSGAFLVGRAAGGDTPQTASSPTSAPETPAAVQATGSPGPTLKTEPSNVVQQATSDFPTNSRGQTYGSDAEAGKISEMPDLIAVVGDHHEAGYVRRGDLHRPAPRSPAEALALQAQQQGTPQVLDVYDAEGTRVIDTFTLSRSEVTTDSDGPAAPPGATLTGRLIGTVAREWISPTADGPLPLTAGTVYVVGQWALEAEIDAAGHFELAVPPGRYWVAATSPYYQPNAACLAPRPVRVPDGGDATVEVLCPTD